MLRGRSDIIQIMYQYIYRTCNNYTPPHVIDLHFGTGIIGVNLRKQASDYTWRPIIDVLLYL